MSFRGALNWATLTSRDASLSDSYTSDRCCFSIQALLQVTEFSLRPRWKCTLLCIMQHLCMKAFTAMNISYCIWTECLFCYVLCISYAWKHLQLCMYRIVMYFVMQHLCMKAFTAMHISYSMWTVILLCVMQHSCMKSFTVMHIYRMIRIVYELNVSIKSGIDVHQIILFFNWVNLRDDFAFYDTPLNSVWGQSKW